MFLLDRLLGALRVRRHSPERVHRQTLPISRRLSENLIYISRTLSDAPDLVQRKLQIGKNGTAAMLFYLTGLTNETTIQESVLRPLLHYTGHTVAPEAVQQEVLEAGRVRLLSDLNLTISELLRGQLVLLLDGSAQSIAIEARQYPGRAVTEPTAEKTITGPREGFVENIQQNTALVRRRLPSPNFKSRTLQLGTITRTNISVCYMEDKVQTGLLEEVLQRLEHLQQFDLPEVLDTSYVGQAIEDHPLSPFPQTMSTERPDRTVANLLEGRVCILVDGTPKALIIPAGLFDQFQSPEDYYQRPWVATMARWIRYLAAVLATTSSALYVAILTFHYEVIPHRLIVNVARSRSLVPFRCCLRHWHWSSQLNCCGRRPTACPAQSVRSSVWLAP